MSALLVQHPEMALFLALAFGHLIGMIRVGPIQLGGVCGTLIVALILGQTGVRLDPDLKAVAFALFIFALGYTGGPQFFANVGKGWRYGLLSLVEVVAVLAVVMTATVLLSLNAGAAAGLLAGAATESAVIGTASEAVSRLALAPDQIEALQGQIATAYSITYLFGLITIVLFTSQLAPILLRVDLKAAAADLAGRLGETEGGGQAALPELVGRAFAAGEAAGASVADFEARHDHAVTVARLRRGEATIEPGPSEQIQSGDILLLVGRRAAVVEAASTLGPEVVRIGLDMPLVRRSYVLKQAQAAGRTVADLRRLAPLETRRGVFILGIQRLGHAVPVLPDATLQSGDVLELYGAERAVARAGQALGQATPPADKTDFIMLGLGVLAGILIGALGANLGGIHVTLGAGGGCLLSGLVFGWYASRHAGFGVFPAASAQILKDFGLAAFIAAVGFSAGPDAFRLIREYGVWLPLAGVLAALIPASLSLFIGHRLLKLETPFLLGAIAGQQCSTPAISALVSASGNSTPVVGYTVTYAISNVLLPLLGPVVVGLAFHLT
ncbi:aspartate-alanine antiporter [Brevundimonas sp.]|uniref:aspartate-alanine antiporter n=1 Tax=Brevundimonas sp. TaxID=1871086 RepID=UPI003D6D554E